MTEKKTNIYIPTTRKIAPKQASGKLGRLVVDASGSVVMVAPEDEPTPRSEQQANTVVDQNQDVVTIKVEGDKDTSQVTDAELEFLSNKEASNARKENRKRAKEAQVNLKPRKDGNSVVFEGTYDDAVRVEQISASEKTESSNQEDDNSTSTKSESVFPEDSEEDYKEFYDEDDENA